MPDGSHLIKIDPREGRAKFRLLLNLEREWHALDSWSWERRAELTELAWLLDCEDELPEWIER